MARKRERAFAAFGAILFIVSSSAFTVAVILQMISNGKNKSDASSATTSQTKKETNMENTLQGKPLANFTPIASIPTLQHEDIIPGTGDTVKPGDTITVDYTGAVAATGIVFQSSKDSGQPVSFPLSGVIKGWQDGIPGVKVGGTRRVLIPAALAYGANPPSGSGIPSNADLVFDVTVRKIGQ